MPGAWTAPSTWTAGLLVNETMLNAQIRDNMLWLGGNTGVITQVITAVASGSNPTTTSASPVALADPTVSITTLAGSVLIAICQATFINSSAGAANSVFLGVDGTATSGGVHTFTTPAINAASTITSLAFVASTTAATHTLQMYWATNLGTLTRSGIVEGIVAMELRR